MKLYVITLYYEMDATTAAAISSSIDNMSGYMASTGASKKQRQWNEKMYSIQRADKLKDWNMQNEYNSPEKQMERLKAGGLNPNLVYGNGTSTIASPIPQAEVKSWDPKVPPTNFGSGLMAALTVQQQQLQNANLESQNELIQTQIKNLESNIVNRNADTENKKWQLSFNTKTQQLQIDTGEAKLNNINVSSDTMQNAIAMSRNRNYREIVQLSSNLKEATQRIAESIMRTSKLMPAQMEEIAQRIQNMEKSGAIMQREIDLNKMGTQKGDPLFFRAITEILNEAFK